MKRILNTVPRKGDKGTGDVKKLQDALIERGYRIGNDDWFWDETEGALQRFQKACGLPGTGVIPADGGKTFQYLDLVLDPLPEEAVPVKPQWMVAMEKLIGGKESNSVFNKYIAGFWKYVGLGYTSITGSARAWCGVAIVVALITGGGYAYIKNGAGAKNWDKAGQAVNWKENGIPYGAIVRINHSAKCDAGSGNHVTFMNGACAKKDIIEMVKNSKGVFEARVKSGATFPGLGGNQGDQVKESWYPVAHICAVRWPNDKDNKPLALPAPVLVSNGCNGKAASKESTQ